LRSHQADSHRASAELLESRDDYKTDLSLMRECSEEPTWAFENSMDEIDQSISKASTSPPFSPQGVLENSTAFGLLTVVDLQVLTAFPWTRDGQTSPTAPSSRLKHGGTPG
jgi:hypothetical protein